ncbi:MAG TPA: phosphatase PAP2 family protein [Solirubrobacteraceae bacterium]|nr:phosphatase PAP2 family protein [Solirubrobacteraceae bacterium]
MVLPTAAAAPVALCVAVRRSRARDVATCALQMWAYVAAYQIPHDDPEALERRVHIDYPVNVDRVLGLGLPPNLRLQRLASPDRFTPLDKLLVWAHWVWFFVPHTSLLYVMLRHREQFPRAAVQMYGVFDLGAVVYWAVPTAPPWYAARHGRMAVPDMPHVRRMMEEYGAEFWKDNWGPLYSFLGGNPLAAMPSLHFATSVMAAQVLTDTGTVAGAVGWTYALTLGFALVYLGEHYLVDLLAGFTLTQGVRHLGPRAAPLLLRVSRGIQRLEARAHA